MSKSNSVRNFVNAPQCEKAMKEAYNAWNTARKAKQGKVSQLRTDKEDLRVLNAKKRKNRTDRERISLLESQCAGIEAEIALATAEENEKKITLRAIEDEWYAHWKSFQENSESGPQSKKAKVPEGYDDFGSSDLSNLSDDDSPASVTGKPREEAPDEKAEVSTKQKRRATAPPAKVVPKKTKVGEPSDGVIQAAGKPMTRRSNRTTRSQNKDTTPCEVLTGKTTLSLKGITADPASSGAKTAVSANDETTGAATTSCVASSTRAPASDPTTDEALSQHASSLMVPAPPAAVPVPLVTDGPSSSPLDGANDIPNALASKDISSSVVRAPTPILQAASTPDSCTGANALTDPNVGEDIQSHQRDAEASGDEKMNLDPDGSVASSKEAVAPAPTVAGPDIAVNTSDSDSTTGTAATTTGSLDKGMLHEVLTGKLKLSLEGGFAVPASSGAVPCGAKTASADDKPTGAAVTSSVASSTWAPASHPTTDETFSQHTSSVTVPISPAAVPASLTINIPKVPSIDRANDSPDVHASRGISSPEVHAPTLTPLAVSMPDGYARSNAVGSPNSLAQSGLLQQGVGASGDGMMNFVQDSIPSGQREAAYPSGITGVAVGVRPVVKHTPKTEPIGWNVPSSYNNDRAPFFYTASDTTFLANYDSHLNDSQMMLLADERHRTYLPEGVLCLPGPSNVTSWPENLAGISNQSPQYQEMVTGPLDKMIPARSPNDAVTPNVDLELVFKRWSVREGMENGKSKGRKKEKKPIVEWENPLLDGEWDQDDDYAPGATDDAKYNRRSDEPLQVYNARMSGLLHDCIYKKFIPNANNPKAQYIPFPLRTWARLSAQNLPDCGKICPDLSLMLMTTREGMIRCPFHHWNDKNSEINDLAYSVPSWVRAERKEAEKRGKDAEKEKKAVEKMKKAAEKAAEKKKKEAERKKAAGKKKAGKRGTRDDDNDKEELEEENAKEKHAIEESNVVKEKVDEGVTGGAEEGHVPAQNESGETYRGDASRTFEELRVLMEKEEESGWRITGVPGIPLAKDGRGELAKGFAHCGCTLASCVKGWYLWKTGLIKAEHLNLEEGWKRTKISPREREFTIAAVETHSHMSILNMFDWELINTLGHWSYRQVSTEERLQRQVDAIMAKIAHEQAKNAAAPMVPRDACGSTTLVTAPEKGRDKGKGKMETVPAYSD